MNLHVHHHDGHPVGHFVSTKMSAMQPIGHLANHHVDHIVNLHNHNVSQRVGPLVNYHVHQNVGQPIGHLVEEGLCLKSQVVKKY